MLIITTPQSPHATPAAVEGTQWRCAAAVPLDRNGPIDAPFVRPDEDVAEGSVFAWFERIARAMPAAGALDDGTTTLSYADVHAQAQRLARVVAAQVPSGRAVAVLLPNAPASVIAVLACLAARRCCVVLNADHPAERNRGILRDADVYAAIALRDGAADGVIPDGTVRIDFHADAAGAAPVSDAAHDPDGPAVVLYTSGSDGQPKGIVLSQATILTRVRNNIVASHVGRDDRFLSLGALGTTAGFVAGLIALLAGALQFVVSVSAEGASSVLDLIRTRRVTVLWGVPALLGLLFDGRAGSHALHSLRAVRTFGDRLLSTEYAAWRAALPPVCDLAITYGQTEATVAQWHVPRDHVADAAVLPTGYLLPEHEYCIVGEDGLPAHDDVGELIVRSRFVALGEWAHGRLVAGRLKADPIDPRRRILATGDLVRLEPVGLLQVMGRVDRQVKINGQRVEPAEVETALRRVAGVSDAAVVVRRDGENTSLVAFLVARDAADKTLRERAHQSIRRSLPRYLQPARLLIAERLPMLPGGKVDHRALLKLDAMTPQPTSRLASGLWRGGRTGASPTSIDAHRAITLAWRRVLRSTPAPGVTFLDAAGDSLRLLELVFALESLTRRRLPLDAFSVDSTAVEMAAALDVLLRSPAPAMASERVFLLPGARGDTPGLAGLRADCLPISSIQMVTYPGWREMFRSGATLDTIAEASVAQIRSMSQPGPLCLIGYSFGAYVAYCVACLLEREGREVTQLVLIDMPAPRPDGRSQMFSPSETLLDRAPAGRLRDGLRELWWSAHRLLRAAREGMASERIGMHVASAASAVVTGRRVRAWAASRATAGWSRRLGDLGYWINHHLAQEYRLEAANAWARKWSAPTGRLGASLLLIRSEAHRPEAPEDLGWRTLVERVRVVRVSGTHVTMLSAANRNGVSDAVGVALAAALATGAAAHAPPAAGGRSP